jgi:4'-phosphopantetheinyl transferase
MKESLEMYVCKIDCRIPDEEFGRLLSYVDSGKRARIQRFRRWQDAHLSLFADLLARSVIGRRLKLAPENLIFTVDPFGKPSLDDHDSIHFNVSHSVNRVACVIDRGPVGIDIEEISEADLSIANEYFAASEVEYLLTELNPVDAFFDLWTIKESYIKFIGKGLSQPLNSFNVLLGRDGVSHISANGVVLPDVYIRSYPYSYRYKLAVCATHNLFPDHYNIISQEDLTRIFLGYDK